MPQTKRRLMKARSKTNMATTTNPTTMQQQEANDEDR